MSGVGTERDTISFKDSWGTVKGNVVRLSQKVSWETVQEIAQHLPPNVRQVACDAAQLKK